MNLQFLTIEHLAKTNVVFDAENVVLQNIIFDINSLLMDLEHDIVLHNGKLNSLNFKCTRFKMQAPNIYEYNLVRNEIEECLFDDFFCQTVEHVKWKEYFHGLYDLVAIAKTDRTTHIILLQELLKYYDVLDKPNMVGPNDEMYIDINHLVDLFNKLKVEHEYLVIPNINDYFKKHIELITKFNIDYMEAKKALKVKKNLRDRYLFILKWTHQPA